MQNHHPRVGMAYGAAILILSALSLLIPLLLPLGTWAQADEPTPTPTLIATVSPDEAYSVYLPLVEQGLTGPGTPTPEPSGTPSPEPSGTPSPEPSGTPSPEPSGTPSPEPSGTPSPEPSGTPSPQPSGTPSPEPSGTPSPEPSGTPDLDWDPRLDQRGATLIRAAVTPGAGYWRLVRARWYNTEESAGLHHIFMDTLNAEGTRQPGVPLLVSWPEGSTPLQSEAKPGEPYAADFGMFALAPAYAARPHAGVPADRVDGMGMGEIDDPFRAHHTSYGLVWQWSIAADPNPTATATPTLAPTFTPTPEPDGSATPPAPTATVTPAATSTMTPTMTPTAAPTPTATATGQLAFSAAVYAGCTSDANATRITGVVYYNNQPADGYRVVFSWQPDGQWITPPAVSGPTPPGAYTHIVSERAGNWWVWIVDAQGARISPMALYPSTAACNIGEVNFYGP